MKKPKQAKATQADRDAAKTIMQRLSCAVLPGMRGYRKDRDEVFMTIMQETKEDQLELIWQLIGDVAGTVVGWEELKRNLSRMPLRSLIGLHYRIERVVAQAYDEGYRKYQSCDGKHPPPQCGAAECWQS